MIAAAAYAPVVAPLPPGADLARTAPLPGAPGPVPPGLEGWSLTGPLAPGPTSLAGGEPAVRLGGNTTLRTPPLPVPAGAQTLLVRAASAGGLLAVRAEDDAGLALPLATLAPPAGGGVAAVPVAALAERTVRIVLDPVTAFGGAVDVAELGPFDAPLPGWMIAGAPLRTDAAGLPALLVEEDPLTARAPAAPRPGGLRALIVAVRGTGVVRLRAGGRPVTRAVGARWTDVRVPVPPRGPVVLEMTADPEGGRLLVRDIGLPVRAVAPRGVRVARRARRLGVRGSVGPAGRGLRVVLEDRHRPLGATFADRSGRFQLAARLRPGRTAPVLVVRGDRTRDGARVALGRSARVQLDT